MAVSAAAPDGGRGPMPCAGFRPALSSDPPGLSIRDTKAILDADTDSHLGQPVPPL